MKVKTQQNKTSNSHLKQTYEVKQVIILWLQWKTETISLIAVLFVSMGNN